MSRKIPVNAFLLGCVKAAVATVTASLVLQTPQRTFTTPAGGVWQTLPALGLRARSDPPVNGTAQPLPKPSLACAPPSACVSPKGARAGLAKAARDPHVSACKTQIVSRQGYMSPDLSASRDPSLDPDPPFPGGAGRWRRTWSVGVC